MTPRWTHLAFCAIWLCTAVMFARLAVDSYGATKTDLTRFYVHFPPSATVTIMGVDLPRLVTRMAETNNDNVSKLEDSIRRSARLTFRLNLVSALMAIVGLVAQISVYIHEERRRRA